MCAEVKRLWTSAGDCGAVVHVCRVKMMEVQADSTPCKRKKRLRSEDVLVHDDEH